MRVLFSFAIMFFVAMLGADFAFGSESPYPGAVFFVGMIGTFLLCFWIYRSARPSIEWYKQKRKEHPLFPDYKEDKK